MSIQLNPLLPGWLIFLLIGAFAAALMYGTATMLRKQVAGKWVGILTGLRLAVFAVFVLILLQPAFSYSSSTPQLPELLILVDASQSMGKTSAGSGTRLEEVTAALQKGELADALRSKYRLRWFAFDRTALPIDEKDLATLKADGATTDYASSIESACDHVRALGKNPQRLLMVSDGNDLGQTDPVETARRFGLAVDVLAPAASKKGEAPAIEIAEVQSARRVLLGSETHFRVTLSAQEPLKQDSALVLRVLEDGKKILEHPAVLKAGRTEQNLLLTHRPTTAGLKQYRFQLVAGEQKSRSDYPLTVQVLDSKYEVLILEDRWRWEYKYLHRLFEEDPSFRFSALLARGGGSFVRFGSPDSRVKLIGFPQSRADLEGFDVFVLGDVNPAQWPKGLASDLARLVTEEGKSLVVIAGPSLSHYLEIPELHALLPVELTPESGKPIAGPIAVRQSSDGTSSPFFFQLRAGDTEKLPPLDQIYPASQKRSGAKVLLEAVKHRNQYGPSIVIAEQTIGRGQVLFLATDTLWKWHTLAPNNEGPTPYAIFWQQAFRAMTPARSNTGSVNLWLTANRSRAEVGKPVGIVAEVQSSRVLPSGDLKAFVTLPDEKRLPLVFGVDPANPRLFRTEYSSSVAGLHRITASLDAKGKNVAEGSTVIQMNELHGETADAGIDLANLARIAQDTGGHLLDAARPGSWGSSAQEPLPQIRQTHTVDLWNNFSLLLVLCALLGTDWFIRLFRGLVAG